MGKGSGHSMPTLARPDFQEAPTAGHPRVV